MQMESEFFSLQHNLPFVYISGSLSFKRAVVGRLMLCTQAAVEWMCIEYENDENDDDDESIAEVEYRSSADPYEQSKAFRES